MTAHDIAQLSMQLPMIGGTFLAGLVPETSGKKKKGKGGDVVMLNTTEALEAGDGKKRKRGPNKDKKPKDPNAPKRPPSAYLLYQNEVRKDIREQHPDMTYPQVLQEISKMWTGLSELEKKPYLDATSLAKGDYEKVKQEYEKEHPQGGVPAAAATPAAATATDAEEDEEPEPEPVPVLVSKSKATKPVSKAKGKTAAKAAPPPVVESSSSDEEEDAEEDEDVDADSDEVEPPPKKKAKKEPTPPPPKKGRKGK